LRQLGCQVASGDGDFRGRIADVVLDLFGSVHRIHRHHHGIGSQDGQMRDHQLRCVLHVNHDAIPAHHTKVCQRSRQGIDLSTEFAVCHDTIKEDQCRTFRPASHRSRQIAPKRVCG
jgi:hypothetical protein